MKRHEAFVFLSFLRRLRRVNPPLPRLDSGTAEPQSWQKAYGPFGTWTQETYEELLYGHFPLNFRPLSLGGCQEVISHVLSGPN